MNFKEQYSPYSTMRCWLAISHNYSFVITLEIKTGEGFENYTGYTASWKNRNFDIKPFGKQPSNRIEAKPWKTFKEAEEACKATLKQLLQKQ